MKNNRTKTRQNLRYIQFVPHREQHSALWWENPFGDGSVGTWLYSTLRTAPNPPVIRFEES